MFGNYILRLFQKATKAISRGSGSVEDDVSLY